MSESGPLRSDVRAATGGVCGEARECPEVLIEPDAVRATLSAGPRINDDARALR